MIIRQKGIPDRNGSAGLTGMVWRQPRNSSILTENDFAAQKAKLPRVATNHNLMHAQLTLDFICSMYTAVHFLVSASAHRRTVALAWRHMATGSSTTHMYVYLFYACPSSNSNHTLNGTRCLLPDCFVSLKKSLDNINITTSTLQHD